MYPLMIKHVVFFFIIIGRFPTDRIHQCKGVYNVTVTPIGPGPVEIILKVDNLNSNTYNYKNC